ncbi:hypothetical protein MOQ_007534, partial [Trypanosoma cruzi marinkellei]
MHRTPHTTHGTHSPATTPTHRRRRRSKQERRTRPHRTYIRREQSVVPATLTEGTRTHEGGAAAHTATQEQSKNERKVRSPHTTWIFEPREAQPIFIKKRLVMLFLPRAVTIKSEYRKGCPYKSEKCAVANGPPRGLSCPRQSQSQFPTTRIFPQWMRRTFPWSVGVSAARGVCDEAAAKGPGPSRVPAVVLPVCPACWHAWRFRWRPARKAPVRKTVAPLRHPRVSPYPNIGTPGRARRACVLILWTERRTLLQVGQDDVNPLLAGRQGVAVLTSGRGSGGGGGGPVSSVRQGRHHRHRGFTCDLQGARRPAEKRAGV